MRTLVFVLLAAVLLAPHDAAADREADRLYEEAVRRHGKVRPAQVFALYARAAEAGHPAAQYNVAMMYSNGEAVNVDYQQAVYWFRKSADQRFAPALHRLGELYYFGMGGLPRDAGAAAQLFDGASRQGDPDGCMNLAMLEGAKETPDPARVGALLDCAEEGGNEWAAHYRLQFEVSPGGRFEEQDRREYWARQEQYWVEMAARFGVREAEEAVGGAPRDDAGARERLRDGPPERPE